MPCIATGMYGCIETDVRLHSRRWVWLLPSLPSIIFVELEPIWCLTTLLIHLSSFAVFVFGHLLCASFSCGKAKALVCHSKSTCEHRNAWIWMLFPTSLQLKKRLILHVQMCRWSVLYVLQPQVQYGSTISKLTSKNSTYLLSADFVISESEREGLKKLWNSRFKKRRQSKSSKPKSSLPISEAHSSCQVFSWVSMHLLSYSPMSPAWLPVILSLNLSSHRCMKPALKMQLLGFFFMASHILIKFNMFSLKLPFSVRHTSFRKVGGRGDTYKCLKKFTDPV